MMRPCAACACVRCVRLRSWIVVCPPFPLRMSLCCGVCAVCVRVPRFCSKLHTSNTAVSMLRETDGTWDTG
eukprot:4068410-Prymnesium_polylepis.2